MCLLGVVMTFKCNSLCLLGQSTVLAYWWLHHCFHTKCSCLEKTRFTFSYFSSWMRILPLWSTLVSPSGWIIAPFSTPKVAKRSSWKLWLIHHVAVLQFRSETQSISHWSSVDPSYRTESGYWSSNMVYPSYHNDNLKIQKRKNKLNFDRNIVFKTWSLLKHCTGSVSSQLIASFLVYRAAS